MDMRILSVPTKSLMDIRWVDLSVYRFSPRQILSLTFGLGLVAAAVSGSWHPASAAIGLFILVIGLKPSGFLAPERQIAAMLQFHLGVSGRGTKKRRPEASRLAGAGLRSADGPAAAATATAAAGSGKSGGSPAMPKSAAGTENTMYIDDIEMPLTITVRTSAEKRFTRCAIYMGEPDGAEEQLVASAPTEKGGRVSWTVMIDRYGPKRIRIAGPDGEELYRDTVRFAKKGGGGGGGGQ